MRCVRRSIHGAARSCSFRANHDSTDSKHARQPQGLPQVRQLAIRSLFEIIEQSSEGTVIVDRQARIVWMNERYARRFGLADAASAIGQPCEAVIPGSLMREVVSNGKPILLDMLDTPTSRWW
jgi:transcriptional regulator with PAS, ATPase and Fis domain